MKVFIIYENLGEERYNIVDSNYYFTKGGVIEAWIELMKGHLKWLQKSYPYTEESLLEEFFDDGDDDFPKTFEEVSTKEEWYTAEWMPFFIVELNKKA